MPLLTQDEVLHSIKTLTSFIKTEIGDIDFRNQSFSHNLNFEGAVFRGTVNFSAATFKGEAYFADAEFFGKVTFENARFLERSYFARSVFHDEITFKEAVFEAKAVFGNTRFLAKASFENARFQKETYFGYCSFSEANFYAARFVERTFFDGDQNNRVFSADHPTYLVSVLFQKPEEVMFRTVSLAMCSLINTDLSKVELTDIQWFTKRGWLDQRKVIYDEISNDPNKNYQLVEKACRQLKKNYEDRGSYGEAGDFHYGEMEMRRLSQKGIRRIISLTSFYKYLSCYGENYWRAFFWLVIFLSLFSMGYFLSGLSSRFTVDGVAKVIDYDFSSDLTTLFQCKLWQDYLDCVVYSLEVATFQRERSYTPLSPLGKFMVALETIFLSVQVALAILAIRRRFRR